MTDFSDIDKYTVYVGNLDKEVTEEILFELFLQAGPVKSVKIPFDHSSGHQKKFGFVVFKHQVSVNYAIHLMNGIKLYNQQLILNIKQKYAGDGVSSYHIAPQKQVMPPMPSFSLPLPPQPPFLPPQPLMPNMNIVLPYPINKFVPPPPLPPPVFHVPQVPHGLNNPNNGFRPMYIPPDCQSSELLCDSRQHPQKQIRFLNLSDGTNRNHPEHSYQSSNHSVRRDRNKSPHCSRDEIQISSNQQEYNKCVEKPKQRRSHYSQHATPQHHEQHHRQKNSNHQRQHTSPEQRRSRHGTPTRHKQSESPVHRRRHKLVSNDTRIVVSRRSKSPVHRRKHKLASNDKRRTISRSDRQKPYHSKEHSQRRK